MEQHENTRSLDFRFGACIERDGRAGAGFDSCSKTEPYCLQSGLKKWSAESAETWTIDQIYEHMTVMQACAETSVKKEKKYKKVMDYLSEFYRAHGELGTRALEFIQKRELSAQFREEENGVSPAQSAQKNDVEKH